MNQFQTFSIKTGFLKPTIVNSKPWKPTEASEFGFLTARVKRGPEHL